MMRDYWNRDATLVAFLKTGNKLNAGVLALCVAIAGADPHEALSVFCGIPYSKKPHKRCNDRFALWKMHDLMTDMGITYTDMGKRLGIGRGTLSKMFYEGKGQRYVYKSKRFISRCEQALGLDKGSLIYKEDRQ